MSEVKPRVPTLRRFAMLASCVAVLTEQIRLVVFDHMESVTCKFPAIDLATRITFSWPWILLLGALFIGRQAPRSKLYEVGNLIAALVALLYAITAILMIQDLRSIGCDRHDLDHYMIFDEFVFPLCVLILAFYFLCHSVFRAIRRLLQRSS